MFRARNYILGILLLCAQSVSMAQETSPALPHLANAYQDTDQSLAALKAIGPIYVQAQNGRAYFASVYAIVTKGILDKAAAGAFERPECIRDMITGFSNLYRLALLDDLQGRPYNVAPAWATTLQANDNPDEKASVQLMLSMNAHIINDLPQTLDALARARPECSLRAVKNDYFKLNDFFAERMDQLDGELKRIHGLLNPYDFFKNKGLITSVKREFMIQMTFKMRKLAWKLAEHLNNAAGSDEREWARNDIELQASLNAEVVMASRHVFPERGL